MNGRCWRMVALGTSLAGSAGCNWHAGGPSGELLACGDDPCEWMVEEGETRAIETWLADEEGIALEGRPVQLSLTYPEAKGGECFRFSATLDVEPDSETLLQVDANTDGTIDAEVPLTLEGWQYFETVVEMPARYFGVRFSVRKHDQGRAQLALLRVAELGSHNPAVRCSGEPIELGPQNAGAACAEDPGCAEGACAGGACSLCAEAGSCELGERCSDDAHCRSDMTCAAERCSACAARGDCSLGAACDLDAQCATGLCATGFCSTCEHDADCAAEERCVASVEGQASPLVCREQPPATR